MKIKYQLLLCILLSPVVSWGQKVLHVQSPDMKNELQVMIGKELEIAITRNGTTVLQPSAIGMDVHFIGILGENPKIKSINRRSVAEKIPSPIYIKEEVDPLFQRMIQVLHDMLNQYRLKYNGSKSK